jgi:hypothetical protein
VQAATLGCDTCRWEQVVPANYVQRVGRAGRRTGNAFLVTFAGRRPREQYYFAEPRQMIAGEIVPPGCYLSAIEILRRQYVAHLADLAARGHLPGVLPMPRRASALFSESGWLRRLIAAATSDTDGAGRLAGGFLDLFPRHVDDAGREKLREFAERGLKAKADEAEETWNRRLEDLRDRLAAIDKAMSELIESDPVQCGYQRELAAERRGVAKRIGEIGRTDAHGALVGPRPRARSLVGSGYESQHRAGGEGHGQLPLSRTLLVSVTGAGISPQRCWAPCRVMPSRRAMSAQE